MFSDVLTFSAISQMAGQWLSEISVGVILVIGLPLTYWVADMVIDLIKRARGKSDRPFAPGGGET